jgi:FKBP-type peptidyl-prolyl cis-trans isomerase
MTVVARLRLVAALVALAAVTACGSVTPVYPDQNNIQYAQTDLTVGTGSTAAAGNTASVQYQLWLYSESGADHKGSQIDSGAFQYLVGSTQVIKGFDMAVTGMKVGGVRRATVPPSLAYGSQGNQAIPPNAALVFEITLVSVQ